MDDIHPEIQNIVCEPIINQCEATQKFKHETSTSVFTYQSPAWRAGWAEWAERAGTTRIMRTRSMAMTDDDVRANVDMLTNSDWKVRREAVAALGKMYQAALRLHTVAIVGVLTDPIDYVRNEVVELLGKIDKAALTLHAGVIIGMLTNSDWEVRYVAFSALSSVGHAELIPTISAVVGLLADSECGVRCAAVWALGNRGHAALVSYTGAIAGLLTVPISDARCTAVELLELACSAVANILTDAVDEVQIAATDTLVWLKRTRALLHRATVRAKVQASLVCPYAFIWHEYVCERLCAQGGVWAERDRAAFEKDFI